MFDFADHRLTFKPRSLQTTFIDPIRVDRALSAYYPFLTGDSGRVCRHTEEQLATGVRGLFSPRFYGGDSSFVIVGVLQLEFTKSDDETKFPQ
jgi:hypothetical protein